MIGIARLIINPINGQTPKGNGGIMATGQTRSYIFWDLLTPWEKWQAKSLVQNIRLGVLASGEIEGEYLSHDEKNAFLDMSLPLSYRLAQRHMGPKTRQQLIRLIDSDPGRHETDTRETVAGFPNNFFGLLRGVDILSKKSFLPRIEELQGMDPGNPLLLELRSLFIREDRECFRIC
jgi:hypothetical protein